MDCGRYRRGRTHGLRLGRIWEEGPRGREVRLEKSGLAGQPEETVVRAEGRVYAKVPGREAACFCTWHGQFAMGCRAAGQILGASFTGAKELGLILQGPGSPLSKGLSSAE